jgi:tetratricopeptide (TPR) repeat protein
MQQALEQVVHVAVNVADPEGAELADRFVARSQFPVFILTTSAGEVISRWVGFTEAGRFIGTLNASLKDRTTVSERTERLGSSPTVRDALFLANYHKGRGDFTEAIGCYRTALSLGEKSYLDLENEIYQASVNAAWNDALPFDSVPPALEAVLAKPGLTADKAASAVQFFTRLALQKDRIGDALPYLSRGMALVRKNLTTETQAELLKLIADSLLLAAGDTSGATNMYKRALGAQWQRDPRQIYRLGSWSFERRINLAEVRPMLARIARDTDSDLLKGMSLHLLAQMMEDEGAWDRAVQLMQMAVEALPQNRFYHEELARLSARADSSESH